MFASMDPSIDYYKILGIPQNASKADVRSAYLKLAKIWHPDLHRDEKAKTKARAKFIEIGAAYEILHDDGQRKKYDDYRRYGHTQQLPYEHKSNPFNPGNQYSQTEWEKSFRHSMDDEWERIRREQTAWAKSRGKDYQRSYHYSSTDSPFEAFRKNQRPWDPNFEAFPRNPRQFSSIDRLIRTLFSLFIFFLTLRLMTALLFGRRQREYEDWKNVGGRQPPYSPYSNPNSPLYNNKSNKRGLPYNSDSRLKRNQRRGASEYPPLNRTSLRNMNNEGNDDSEDGGITFSDPSVQQRKYGEGRKTRNAYEQQLADQRMIHDLYQKAQNKEMEDMRRKREFDEKFRGKKKRRGRDVVVENDSRSDVNEDYVKYINRRRSNSNSTNWRD